MPISVTSGSVENISDVDVVTGTLLVVEVFMIDIVSVDTILLVVVVLAALGVESINKAVEEEAVVTLSSSVFPYPHLTMADLDTCPDTTVGTEDVTQFGAGKSPGNIAGTLITSGVWLFCDTETTCSLVTSNGVITYWNNIQFLISNSGHNFLNKDPDRIVVTTGGLADFVDTI